VSIIVTPRSSARRMVSDRLVPVRVDRKPSFMPKQPKPSAEVSKPPRANRLARHDALLISVPRMPAGQEVTARVPVNTPKGGGGLTRCVRTRGPEPGGPPGGNRFCLPEANIGQHRP